MEPTVMQFLPHDYSSCLVPHRRFPHSCMWTVQTLILCGKSLPNEVYGIQIVFFPSPRHSCVIDIRQGKLGVPGSQDG
jgi:hypothetical protein